MVIDMKIKPIYSDDSLRHDKFTVSYSVNNGRVTDRVFKNAPSEK